MKKKTNIGTPAARIKAIRKMPQKKFDAAVDKLIIDASGSLMALLKMIQTRRAKA